MRYVFGDYLLDTQCYELWRRGEQVKVRPKVFEVLLYLIRHRHRVVSKDELLEQLWPDQFIGDGSLNACLMAVRRAVGDSGQAQHCVQTLHGRGYRFIAAVEEHDEDAPQRAEQVVLSPAQTALQPDTCPVPLEGTTTQAYPPQLPLASPQDSAAQRPVQESVLPTAAPAPSAPERRHLTVFCCDLVDAAQLAGQLDPEDFRAVVRAYHQVCAEVIQRFEGSIAQYLGSGLLVYFGYPLAHEDDAQRAVRAGLGILAALQGLQPRLERDVGIRLAIRIGVHTGLVVMDTPGTGARQEPVALGYVPNMAVHACGLAAPNTVVISAATQRLVQEYFDCEPVGTASRGNAAPPLAVYQVVQDHGFQSRLEVMTVRGFTPLVGREAEVALLLERWTQVKEGRGQVILLNGDMGIGKSRLVQWLKDHVAGEAHRWLECRCSPYFHQSPWYPLIDLLQRLCQWQQDDTPGVRLARLEQLLDQYRLPLETTVPHLALLLALPLPPERYRPLAYAPQQQWQHTLDALLALLLAMAARQPLLCIVEDVHWIDPSTLALLGLVIDQGPTAALCTVLTCRPTFQPPWGWRTHITPIVLDRLPRPHSARMVGYVAGGTALPADVMQQIVEKTDGVPLFIEEITKAVVESAWLQEQDRQTEALPTLAIPATLHDGLIARLDRLGTAKGIAQVGATIGREFSYALLRGITDTEEATLQQELARLVGAELVYQRGVIPQATYLFKHALIQEAAYQSLLKQTRQQYHRRIVEVLEQQCLTVVAAQPDLLAHHATAAGLTSQAVRYWHRAGEQAFQRGAHQEATAHLRQGLALLHTLPESPTRTQDELDLQVTLGPILMVTHGVTAPEVERAYTRAYALCQQVRETPQLAATLRGLRHFYQTSGQYQTAQALAERLLALAQSHQDPALCMEAHMAMGLTLLSRGAFTAARDHLEHGLAYRAPALRQRLPDIPHPELACLFYSGHVLWYLGYPDQARTRIHAGLSMAQQLTHPHHLVWGQHLGAIFYQLCRQAGAMGELANAVVTSALAQGVQICLTEGVILQGWVLVQDNQKETGLSQMQQGIAQYRARGVAVGLPRYLALLAEAYRACGQSEAGLSVLAEARALVAQTGERLYEAEIHRLTGELLLGAGAAREAEAYFQQALDIARRQQARSLELRAALSLGRLWQSRGKPQAARRLLTEVYTWFTEGFDTTDLQEAAAFLVALGG
jgi:class 3 adenylate cyclase/DNA-binding winged helix-turn-helix (wHTH) protein/predicted ATPase